MIANTKRIRETALYTTLPIINNQSIGEFVLLVPKIMEEQISIAKFLDTECSHVDTIIEKKKAFIEELSTYKKSLIYEYVTGKKEAPL